MPVKTLLAVLCAASIAALPVAQAADAQIEGGIAVINVPLILNDMPQGKASREALAKEFGPRQAELQKLADEGKTLQQSLSGLKGDALVEAQRKLQQMDMEFKLKSGTLQEDQGKRMQEEQIKLLRLVQKAVDTIAKERGLKMVLRGDAVVFAEPAVDLSEEVVARVSKMGNGDEPKGGKAK